LPNEGRERPRFERRAQTAVRREIEARAELTDELGADACAEKLRDRPDPRTNLGRAEEATDPGVGADARHEHA
jgi:hypothetical protein